MMDILKIFDFFSQGPSLRVNGNDKLATVFGSIVSLFAILAYIIGISLILNDYFSFLTPKINSYTDNTIRPDIDLKKFKMGLLLTNGQGKEYQNPEKLFKISAAHWDIKLTPIKNNNDVSVVLTDIPTIKCNEYKNDPILNEEFIMHSTRFNFTCLNYDDFPKNLTGKYGSTYG